MSDITLSGSTLLCIDIDEELNFHDLANYILLCITSHEVYKPEFDLKNGKTIQKER
jgi:hypothetical protein